MRPVIGKLWIQLLILGRVLLLRAGSASGVRGSPGRPFAAARGRAASHDDVLLVDMPAAAQAHRVYDHYHAELASTDPADLNVCAFSLVGPRNRVDKITRKLHLLP